MELSVIIYFLNIEGSKGKDNGLILFGNIMMDNLWQNDLGNYIIDK